MTWWGRLPNRYAGTNDEIVIPDERFDGADTTYDERQFAVRVFYDGPTSAVMRQCKLALYPNEPIAPGSTGSIQVGLFTDSAGEPDTPLGYFTEDKAGSGGTIFHSDYPNHWEEGFLHLKGQDTMSGMPYTNDYYWIVIIVSGRGLQIRDYATDYGLLGIVSQVAAGSGGASRLSWDGTQSSNDGLIAAFSDEEFLGTDEVKAHQLTKMALTAPAEADTNLRAHQLAKMALSSQSDPDINMRAHQVVKMVLRTTAVKMSPRIWINHHKEPPPS